MRKIYKNNSTKATKNPESFVEENISYAQRTKLNLSPEATKSPLKRLDK
jgi:hypothetical protein